MSKSSPSLCVDCVLREVCAVGMLGREWGIIVSRCKHSRLSFSEEKLKAAQEAKVSE